MKKEYIIGGCIGIIFVIVIVVVIIWKMYPSFAHMEQGYEGNNIITGRNWGLNITEVSNVVKKGNAILRTNIDSIATTFNFKAELQEPGDEISFDIKVTNTGKLNAELYAWANVLRSYAERYASFLDDNERQDDDELEKLQWLKSKVEWIDPFVEHNDELLTDEHKKELF